MPRSKKKTQPTTILPDSSLPTKVAPPSAKVTTRIFPVALLIDGENVIVPNLITHILAEAGKMGGVTIRQVYGNWAAPSMQAWKKIVAHYELEQMGNRSGPNATDIALVIGAMDLLHQGIKHFCLVTGDSDYVPLVERLQKGGCTILVIGTLATSNTLKNTSSTFLSTDQLIPQMFSAPHAPSPSSSSSQELTSPQIKSLSTLLTDAYQSVAPQSESEWVTLSTLGTILRQQNPTFEAAYGKKSLSSLVEQCIEFEIRKKNTSNGHQVDEVRLAMFTKEGDEEIGVE
jgi:uncharacterized LabA/DUF88 family protein